VADAAPAWHRQAYAVAAMRRLAQRTLPRPVFDFIDGAAENEYTLRRSEEAWSEIELLPRPLNGSPARDLSIELFGRKLSLPLMIGPTGISGLLWPDGEMCAARAAMAAGTAFCLSHASTCTIEEMAATGVNPRWMQVFIYSDRGFTEEFVARAAVSRYDALVLTIDNQITGKRERDLRNGFTIPPRFSALDLLAMAPKLPWLMRMGPRLPKITFANYASLGAKMDLSAIAAKMADLLDPSLSWSDVDRLRSIWKGPFVLKGVLHPKEAAEAVARGVDGLIVSNHGGRQLDGVPASADALPAILDAVGGRIPVLVDGGIRRGVDVVRALAMGASACLVARPHLYGLAYAGEAGVARVLDIFKNEINRAMGLLGVTKLADLNSDYIRRRQ
jgi:L-lactate dehydrogenase (cytochrome)/(S)-mandelate dehydrogenase